MDGNILYLKEEVVNAWDLTDMSANLKRDSPRTAGFISETSIAHIPKDEFIELSD